MNFRKALALSLLATAFLAPGASALNSQRHGHTATLLPNGNILVAGGTFNTNSVTGNVEMYDMAASTYVYWAGADALDTPRSSHTATLMSDGRVLIAGGFGANGQPVPAANALEICNPKTKVCAAAGVAMLTARGGHTATLLSAGARAGQVLLCGGRTGTTGTSITESCETFNPTGPAVLSASPMVSKREGHAAVLLRSGRVFVTGGRRRTLDGSAWIYTMTNEMYDPTIGAGAWTPASALLQGRINHTATVLNNGKIMIVGGYNETNYLYCQGKADSLEDECWHMKYDPDNVQDAGNHGYLDGAEFFDQNGASVVLAEATYGEIPYRVSQHSAILEPDGTWRMHGGYGAIIPTFFNSRPPLIKDSVISLSSSGYHNASVLGSASSIRFQLAFPLSRPVSGRLVDADAFISAPSGNTSSIEMNNVKMVLTNSTAPADGLAVGLLLGNADYKPGDFKGIVQLLNPEGTAEFSKQTVTSGESPNTTTAVSSTLNIAGGALPAATAGVAITGIMRSNVSIKIPASYRKISGRASVNSGSIADTGGQYSIYFEKNGTGAFSIPEPTSCDENDCVFISTIDFTGLSGTITNLNAAGGAAIPTPVNTAGDVVLLTLELDYNAMEIIILDKKEPTFNFTRSTMVVRGMVFSNQLSYAPDSNKWGDLTDKLVSPALGAPSFNHTALLTPAADTLIMGGRNCEFNPAADCLRSPVRFSTAAVDTIIIPVYKDAAGNDKWAAGQNLNSKRAFHTSTLLADGRILTCGGSDGTKPLATCELMDPKTKKWIPTGPMYYPRSNHTATLLPNGNVLAAGGITTAGVAISSAEVYYPDTQRWVPTTPMRYARQLHTATLMPDGNVLVAGGATLSTYSVTTEIYISSTSYWQDAGDMTAGRAQHTATLLKSGNVLIAGGVNGFDEVGTSEVFGYVSRAFIPALAADLNYPRSAHTANLLRDGRVILIGGTDGVDSMTSFEIYDGAGWTEPEDPDGTALAMIYNRANHRSVLLPNGKIMITGGEMRSTVQLMPESFNPDFTYLNSLGSFTRSSTQGKMTGRANHTAVITRDNLLMTIGGWGGGKYLDTTEYIPFNFPPDMHGLPAEIERQPLISTGSVLFNQGDRVTLLSGTSNFHGITETSGGGAGPANSSFSNPRVYLQQIDNPSGFMVDLSTRIYPLYSGTNDQWSKTLSSITVIMPTAAEAGELPHGWYHMRVAASGVFSDGHTVQVTVPRPSNKPSIATGTILGVSSITWTWNRGGITTADGYIIYSATDNVVVTTVAYKNDNSTIFYTQTGMAPNTAASIMISAYNLGGSGPLEKSATYYTYAAVPAPINITGASFETARLEWARNNNSPATTYEVSMSPFGPPSPVTGTQFSSSLDISTPVPFSVNYTSTSTVITQLSANQIYDFRVRARNGAGIMTPFTDPPASTITVSAINNFTGEALSSSTINWSWDASPGVTYYELYDITNGTWPVVLIGATSNNSLSQTGLSANLKYQAAVSAVNNTAGYGPIWGPIATAPGVYTRTVQPLPATPNVFTSLSTGSFTVNWITNGNSTWTVYNVTLSTGSFSTSYTTGEDSVFFDNLSPNMLYSVQLTPVNGNGVAGTAIDLGSKYTLAKVPASLTPRENSMSGIKLVWDTENNSPATTYEVRGSTGEDVNGDLAAPITTFVKFLDSYTDRSYLVNGLLTATTYYFDVAARNQDAIVTARKRAQATATQPGPPGAPPGSVGGTSQPSRYVTISGFLPTGREVSLGIPTGAFPAATAIAISSSSENKCDYTVGGKTIELAIFSQDLAQPQVPVTLVLHYDSAEAAAAIDTNRLRMVLARYNEVSGQCLPLETVIDTGQRTITATLNHFSYFQLMLRPAAADLDDVLVYPNPFYTNRGQGFVTLANMPSGAKVRLYTLSGDKVWEGTAGTTGILIWRGDNKSGELVASGIYLAVIDSSAGKKVMKLALER